MFSVVPGTRTECAINLISVIVTEGVFAPPESLRILGNKNPGILAHRIRGINTNVGMVIAVPRFYALGLYFFFGKKFHLPVLGQSLRCNN